MRRLVLLALLALLAVGGGSSRLLGEGGSKGGAGRGRVVRVVDGDTLKVRTGNRAVTVRLLGIDTPESVKPGAPVECGGKAAARALERRALTPRGRGRGVRLVYDGSQDRRDRFGRLLAYVELAGGADLGEAQVRDGWAEPFVFEDDPFARVGRYLRAFHGAQDAQRGVHRLCGGDFHRPQ